MGYFSHDNLEPPFLLSGKCRYLQPTWKVIRQSQSDCPVSSLINCTILPVVIWRASPPCCSRVLFSSLSELPLYFLDVSFSSKGVDWSVCILTMALSQVVILETSVTHAASQDHFCTVWCVKCYTLWKYNISFCLCNAFNLIYFLITI